jgi:hypothetical protein
MSVVWDCVSYSAFKAHVGTLFYLVFTWVRQLENPIHNSTARIVSIKQMLAYIPDGNRLACPESSES